MPKTEEKRVAPCDGACGRGGEGGGGAGGIGGTLFAAFQRFDYDYVCAILISIIALIMVGELLATAIRAIFIENATFGDLFRRGAATRRARHVEAD